jgi:hypothetical protein
MISATHEATWTVVISKGQSRNPNKRDLEQRIAEAAQKLDGVNVLVIPHLYDLPKASESFQKLSAIEGDVVVVSWVFSRAAHWVLDRNGFQGQFGDVLLGADADPEDEPVSSHSDDDPDAEPVDRVTDLYPRPNRNIHCIDLKVTEDADSFIQEIRRIVDAPDVKSNGSGNLPIIGGTLVEVEEPASRRWYPVIDFSRCTNCMECVDFCLFGVYGVDGGENILVEQPDNCRKGCPACSRVCPANAIIFPQHKAPAIAGAQIEGDEGFKIDLSQLFGAPAGGDDPIATAARERDEQLLLAGRDAVGIDEQLMKRQADLARKPKDQLDELLDSLEAFDL